jgi:hypothetical protein
MTFGCACGGFGGCGGCDGCGMTGAAGFGNGVDIVGVGAATAIGCVFATGGLGTGTAIGGFVGNIAGAAVGAGVGVNAGAVISVTFRGPEFVTGVALSAASGMNSV